MKSHVTLLRTITRQYGSTLHIKTVRDEDTITRRYENQGSWFLEVSLPLLDDALTQGLTSGVLEPIKGYSLQTGTKIPRFLNGFWLNIFAPDGYLLTDPCPISIQAVRQISRIFKKISEVCSDLAVNRAISSFVETDRNLSSVRIPDEMETFRYVAQQLFSRVIGEVFTTPLVFKHGPGAVAEQFDSQEKFDFPVVSPAILERFGVEPFRPFYTEDYPQERELPARLIAVPKTATKPRLISIEPSYNQFIQQGIHTVLKRALRRVPICDYSSQEPNRRLAMQGSISGLLATVDLSEASDRVHYGVLKAMFGFNPSFLAHLDATRSRSVLLPDGVEHILNKFASMGSALTFPLESMYFTTLVISALCKVDGDYSPAAIQRWGRSRSVRIYGDDIIVPVEYVPELYRTLELVGLKVNLDKSFHTGYFRESCGADYWKGFEVQPIYARVRTPKTTRDVKEIVSYVSLHNQFHDRFGDCEITDLLGSIIKGLLPDIPFGDANSSGDLVLNGIATVERFNKDLWRGERRGYVTVPKRKKSRASSYAKLHASLHRVKGSPTNLLHIGAVDKDHLSHHSRPTSAVIRRRWVPAL